MTATPSTPLSPQVSPPAGWDAAPGRSVELGLPEGQPRSSLRFPKLHLLFGVLLPFLTVALEVFTGWSAEVYADPMPHRWLLAAALSAPLANLALWLRLCLNRPPAWLARRGRALDFANGCALVVSLGYSLLYLPVAPFGLVLALFGIGLLPLSPFFALFTAWRLRVAFAEVEPASNAKRALAWGLAFVALLNLPGLATVAGLRWAASENPASRERGVALLRTLGDRGQMLRAAHTHEGSWVQRWHGVGPADAQRIFYRVTGERFDAVPQPRAAARFFSFGDWDVQQGGTEVGAQQLAGLSLGLSQLDGSVDMAAATSYFEWTMEFANASPQQREARAVIALPEGGVVSRVTLWVNGEPREAAFGGRAQTRQAYQQVVTARRDPLLVTTAGPGRVLAQCFPVPANGVMRIRLGITAPVTDKRISLPRIVERNFGQAAAPQGAGLHTVWIDAGGSAIRRSLDDAGLALPLALPAHPSRPLAWTPDPRSAELHFQQRWQAPLPPARIIAVVDGSASMREHAESIERQLAALAARVEVIRILATDRPARPDAFAPFQFAGGADNVPALAFAQDFAMLSPASAIVWIHGPQPVELSSPATLAQFWRRRPGRAPITAIQIAPGANHILAALDGVAEVSLAHPAPDALFERLAPAAIPVWTREAGAAGEGLRTGVDIARLWASRQVQQLAGVGLTARATETASAYRVVTPVSGAVVLETQQQYDQAGLKPSDALTGMASVPEPGTLLLFLIGAPALFAARRFLCHTK